MSAIAPTRRISVVGLGYVGLPVAVTFGRAGLPVVAFDIDKRRIELGNPENNLILSANYDVHGIGLLARTQRFGQVTSFGTTPTNATGPTSTR